MRAKETLTTLCSKTLQIFALEINTYNSTFNLKEILFFCSYIPKINIYNSFPSYGVFAFLIVDEIYKYIRLCVSCI